MNKRQEDLFKDYAARTGDPHSMITTTHRYSCYATHPALKIGQWEVYGGSCGTPIVENADIYIGLDSSMRRAHHYPWNDGPQVVNVFFPITDGTPPKDAVEFNKMIKWLAVQLSAGKLIHIGCIGGHGRTGLVLAALVKEVTGNADAITYVRDNYCAKAVESPTQVQFLHEEFGINKVEASRSMFPIQTGRPSQPGEYAPGTKWDSRHSPAAQNARKAPPKAIPAIPLSLRPGLPTGRFEAPAVASLTTVWGKGIVTFDKQAKPATMESSQEGA